MRALCKAIMLHLVWCGACLTADAAYAQKRVALILGNSNYEKVARLSNTTNDAALMAETFRQAGFDNVEMRADLKIAEMRRALRDFMDKSREADVSVVYYAGHGIEVDNTNYLVPTDAVLERDVDVFDEALTLERVLVSVEPAKQLRLIILDACRDNPFARSMKRTMATRAIGRGLAKVEPTSPNTLIAFASKAGSTASDGDGKNSPFTTALVKHLTKPGLDLRRAFGYVRDDVLKSTANRQEPYVYGSLGGDDVPLVPAKPAANEPQADPKTAVRRDYELALQLATRDGWQAFLQQYPEGFYANLAKGQLKKIVAEEVRLIAAERAREAEQERARLVAEGARQAELATAAAAAKAAENARVAEKAKAVEQEKTAIAERSRLAEQESARIAAEKAKQTQQGGAAAEQAQVTTETAAQGKQQIAALPPMENQQLSLDVPKALQTELRRVGCKTDAIEGSWSTSSQRALDLFNKHSGMKLDLKTASADALDAVKSKSGRVCPLICETGYSADGDLCVKISCSAGYQPNDRGICEKVDKRRTPKRDEVNAKRESSKRALTAGSQQTQTPGQFVCNQQGCRPVRKGCRVAAPGPSARGTGAWNITVEVCD